MLLLDYGRSFGMPLNGVHFGAHVGWTTNGEVATKMREHGARVSAYAHKGWSGGYEVSFPRDAEAVSPLSESVRAREAQGAVA